jgi:hypothetical protein
MSATVNLHNVGSVTIRQHGESGDCRWFDFVFYDAEGKRQAEITAFLDRKAEGEITVEGDMSVTRHREVKMIEAL